jgi:hypothetical protein
MARESTQRQNSQPSPSRAPNHPGPAAVVATPRPTTRRQVPGGRTYAVVQVVESERGGSSDSEADSDEERRESGLRHDELGGHAGSRDQVRTAVTIRNKDGMVTYWSRMNWG